MCGEEVKMEVKMEECVTSSVPVDVCDVTGRPFADPHSLTALHVVDVHKAVV